MMTIRSDDENNAETLGEAMAYRVFWNQFGQSAVLVLSASHGSGSSDPKTSRRLLRISFEERLRAVRAEMQYPAPPGTSPELAKAIAAAFHTTFHHLEEIFFSKFAETCGDETPQQ